MVLENGSEQVHILFLYGHELLLLLLFVVLLLLLVVVHMFIHGLHERVQADAILDRMLILFWG